MSDKPEAATSVVDEYLHGLRSQLADLPAPELSEIMDDARAHLTELAAEIGSDADRPALDARIGTPTAYAAELRAAAGYPPAPVRAQKSPSSRGTAAIAALVLATVFAGFGSLVRFPMAIFLAVLLAVLGLFLVVWDGPGVPSVASSPTLARLRGLLPDPGSTGRRVVDFLGSLQPAWWLIRAVAAGFLVAAATVGSGAAPIVLAIIAVPVSVWIGYRSRADRRWLWAVVPLNAVAAALVFYALVVQLASGPPQSTGSYTYIPPGLNQGGQPVRDIRPFDYYGNPLSNVYLFDQDGRLLDTTDSTSCVYGSSAPSSTAPYPRGTLSFDERTGDCFLVPPAPLAVAVPTAIPTAAPTSAAAPR